MFERLFLASLAISAISTFFVYDGVERALTTDPSMQRLGLGSGFLIGLLVASFAVYLLLWYLIAHKAANVAKWILLVLVVLGVLTSLPGVFQASFDFATLSGLAAILLEIAAVVYLFRTDSDAWLKGEQPRDPTAFD
jgi:hypothetical protein